MFLLLSLRQTCGVMSKLTSNLSNKSSCLFTLGKIDYITIGCVTLQYKSI